ncbi:MAG: hypothetical protein EOS56_10730 [Mesorhizobium sp.]|nr:MAG: hypothetical protein EOS56_10730 [Mesorhizobium sp.]RWC66703.1 MAG: hypothetical protein EOS29_02955 [Mesorhizobium sp.]
MIRPLRDPTGAPYPSDASKPASTLAAAIMNLAEGFARDGIGASSLGFEIFVRWTSLEYATQFGKSGKTRLIEYTTNDDTVSSKGAISSLSGWTRVSKMVQI